MTISFARHQFPPAIIRHAVWLYVRFTLSYRDVEDLLAERGLDISYETVRRWVLKFGPVLARELRRRRPRPTSRRHLDEMAVIIGGRQFWLCAWAPKQTGRTGHRPLEGPSLSRSLAFPLGLTLADSGRWPNGRNGRTADLPW